MLLCHEWNLRTLHVDSWRLGDELHDISNEAELDMHQDQNAGSEEPD